MVFLGRRYLCPIKRFDNGLECERGSLVLVPVDCQRIPKRLCNWSVSLATRHNTCDCTPGDVLFGPGYETILCQASPRLAAVCLDLIEGHREFIGDRKSTRLNSSHLGIS